MCAIKVERERSYISRSVNLNGIVALYIKLKEYFKLGPTPPPNWNRHKITKP